jgi:hypothetical protein
VAEIVIDVNDLIGLLPPTSSPDEPMLVYFPDDPVELPAAFQKLWGMVLLMAVRDRATSVHYHPWRTDGRLTYVVEGWQRYELIPPSDEHAEVMIGTARAVFTPTGLLARLFGHRRTSCGTVRLEVGGNPIVWDAVVWSNGERSGVELIRVTPLEPRGAE